jgi:magnesium transporter
VPDLHEAHAALDEAARDKHLPRLRAGAFLWQRNEALSLVLGFAIFLNICAATLGGVLIPLGLKSMKVDPALAANIFVTTITDVMGFVFFLGIASLAINHIQ